MTWEVLRFELALRLKSKATWICFAIIAALSIRDVIGGHWVNLIESSGVDRNAPYTAYYLLMFHTFWIALFGAGITSVAILRDLQSRVGSFLYAMPLREKGYVLAKYIGGQTALLIIGSGTAVGLALMPLLAQLTGIVPPEQLGPTPWAQLLHAYFLFTVPSVIFFGSVHFALAAWSGRIAAPFAAAALMMIWLTTWVVVFETGVTVPPIIEALDPMGKLPLEAIVSFWSIEQRATALLQPTGPLIWNRLGFVGVGLALLLAVLTTFRFSKMLGKGRSQKKKKSLHDEAAPHSKTTRAEATSVALAQRFGGWDLAKFAMRRGREEFWLETKRIPFRVALLAILLNTVFGAWGYAIPPEGILWPAAQYSIKIAGEIAFVPLFLAATFFAAEIAARDQAARTSMLVDASPIPSWALVLSKVSGVVLLALFFACIPALSALLAQIGRGYSEATPSLFVTSTLFVLFPGFLAYCMLPIVLHSLFNNRMLTILVSLAIPIMFIAMVETDTIEQHMFIYGLPVDSMYSDFKGSAQLWLRYAYMDSYWMSFLAVFLILAIWLWPRGTTVNSAQRLRDVPRRMTGPTLAIASVALALFLGLAWRIDHMVNDVAAYESKDEIKTRRADYETRLAQYKNSPQPRILAVDAEIDLKPRARAAEITSAFTVANPHNAALTTLHIVMPKFASGAAPIWNGQTLSLREAYPEHRYSVYDLPSPLVPGTQATLEIEANYAFNGFANSGYFGTIIADGGALIQDHFPAFGYDRGEELTSPIDREKYGLGLQSKPAAALEARFGSNAARWVTYRLAVTAPEDIALVGPGEMAVQSASKGRTTTIFTGKQADWDIALAFGALQKTQAIGTGNAQPVSIEVFHHRAHDENVERITTAAQTALSDLSTRYGRYPYASLRIAEVANRLVDTARFNDVILIPEQGAWLHNYDAGPGVDWISYSLTSQLAGAWWDHAATSADMVGAPILAEAIAAYEGLRALKEADAEGYAIYTDFLRNRYFKDRELDARPEAALLRAYDQDYLIDKAALTFMSIRNLLGQQVMDAQLSSFLKAARQTKTPMHLEALVDHLKAAATADKSAGINHLFDAPGAFQVSAQRATATETTIDVTFRLTTDAPSKGKLPLGFIFFAGSENTDEVYAETRMVTPNAAQTLRFDLPAKTTRVQLDPDGWYLEMLRTDNTVPITRASQPE